MEAYRGIDGNLYLRKQTSRHHVFARSLAHGSRMKQFINLIPLVPRIINENHFVGNPYAVHEHVEPLHPPRGFVVTSLRQVIHSLDHGGYDGLIEFTDKVEHMSLTHGNKEIRKDCGRIADNLQRQMPYILLGQVEVELIGDGGGQ